MQQCLFKFAWVLKLITLFHLSPKNVEVCFLYQGAKLWLPQSPQLYILIESQPYHMVNQIPNEVNIANKI